MKERFEDLFGRLSPKMRSIAHRMNGHRTFFSDDDLYQESAVNMWSLYGAGELDGKTDSYILQGCYFHLKNYLRTHLDKARPVSIDAPIDESGMTLKDTLASETASGYNAVAPGLMAEGTVLRKLDEREQEVLRLLMEGLTVREIGDRLGISHVMVVKLWRRMRDKCRALRSHP